MSKAPVPAAAEESTSTALVGRGESLPAFMQEDLEKMQGAGVSDRSQDFALPFLAIAQSNSPQLKRQQPDKYIEGLEAGDIFNTATRQFWRSNEGIAVVPVWFEKSWVEWVLRDDGGGYVNTYPADHEIVKTARYGGKDKRFFLLPNGHQLVDTSYHFVMDAATGSVLVVSMTSTGLQCSRMWQTLMKDTKVPHNGDLVVAPCFSRVYRLRTAWKKNDQGDWFTWSVSPEGWTPSSVYRSAREFTLEAQERGVQLGRPPVVDDADTSADTSADLSRETPI